MMVKGLKLKYLEKKWLCVRIILLQKRHSISTENTFQLSLFKYFMNFIKLVQTQQKCFNLKLCISNALMNIKIQKKKLI